QASTRRPSTLPATVALARPGPIEAATSATETGWSNWRLEPSGSVMLIIAGTLRATKRRHEGACFCGSLGRVSAVGGGSVHVARSAGVAAGHLRSCLTW